MTTGIWLEPEHHIDPVLGRRNVTELGRGDVRDEVIAACPITGHVPGWPDRACPSIRTPCIE